MERKEGRREGENADEAWLEKRGKPERQSLTEAHEEIHFRKCRGSPCARLGRGKIGTERRLSWRAVSKAGEAAGGNTACIRY